MEIDIKIPNELQYYLDNCEVHYGYAYMSGWMGIGVCYRDPKDPEYTIIWFDNEDIYNTEDELIYCDLMRMNILESMGLLYKNNI